MKNRLILMLLAALGFATACGDSDNTSQRPDKGDDEQDPIIDLPVAYGCPWVTYSVKGRVANDAGEPVKGIDVGLEHDNHDIGTFTTNENGEFVIEQGSTFDINPNGKEILVFTDIDGEENGSYETQEVEVSFVRNEDIPSDDWYNGDYVATEDVEVVLQAKSETNQ